MRNCDYEYSNKTRCAKGGFYKEHEGQRYCVLHYPGKEKSKEFSERLARMIDGGGTDYDFRGVWFPEGRWFRGRMFDKKVTFDRATFGAKADFYDTKFNKGASFRNTTFTEKADFSSASFGEESSSASPEEKAKFANFKHAKFNSSADFKRATFHCEADFEYAVFRADARFSREEEIDKSQREQSESLAGASREEEKDKGQRGQIDSLNLRYAVIDKPERISFHNIPLLPRWFVDADPRKFDFTRVTWKRVSSGTREGNIRKNIADEIEDLRKEVASPYASLSLTARRLAVNAEENNRYDEASVLRYWSMEVLRMGRRHGETTPGLLHRLYHFVSGYGERMGRALLILLTVWALFAGLYVLTGHIRPQGPAGLEGYFSTAVRALNYSLQVITLQKPAEPKFGGGYVTPLLVTFETVLGPLQAALLALAIRRKFMR